MFEGLFDPVLGDPRPVAWVHEAKNESRAHQKGGGQSSGKDPVAWDIPRGFHRYFRGQVLKCVCVFFFLRVGFSSWLRGKPKGNQSFSPVF